MPGIIAASWRPDQAQRAQTLFRYACDCYAHLKGLACSSQIIGPTHAVARFPGPRSPCPDTLESGDGRLTLAGAGWWYDPDVSDIQPPSLKAIAKSYESEGEKALHRLQGQYLIIIHDSNKGQLLACSDHLGMFPFYVAESAGIAWCCTSSLVLAAALGAKLDPQAVHALFVDGAMRSPRSAFQGIRRIEMGEQVQLADGRAIISRQWIPFQSPRQHCALDDAVEQCLALLRRSCRHIHQVWPNCVSDLTGGLDSRLTVAVVTSLGLPVHVTVVGHDSNLDVIIARRIAQRFQWPLYWFVEPPDWGRQRWELFQQAVSLAEGELPASAVDSVVRIKRALSGNFDAALSGGGGELYRDFFWQQEFLRIGRTSELDISRVFRYRFLFSAHPQLDLFEGNWYEDYVEGQIQTAQKIVDLAPDALNTAKLDAIYLWKSSGHFARYAGAINHLIPSPLPLLSGNIFELLVSLPWRYRASGQLPRHIITRANPMLAAMPTWYGGSAEPLGIRHPFNYLCYAIGAFKKLVRKFGQLTLKNPIFRNPCRGGENPAANSDFIGVLNQHGFLSIDNLHSISLYNPDGLRSLLLRAREPNFVDVGQLYAVITLELLCRMCESPLTRSTTAPRIE